MAATEREIKEKIPESVRKVNHKKQILLMTQLLKEIEYPDDDVAFRCYTGFPLVGEMPKIPVFEQRPEEDVIEGADKVWLARIGEKREEDFDRTGQGHPG